MSGLSLQQELREKRKLMNDALNQIKARGKELAKAEHDYRVALRQCYLEELDKGMAVSALRDISKRCARNCGLEV